MPKASKKQRGGGSGINQGPVQIEGPSTQFVGATPLNPMTGQAAPSVVRGAGQSQVVQGTDILGGILAGASIMGSVLDQQNKAYAREQAQLEKEERERKQEAAELRRKIDEADELELVDQENDWLKLVGTDAYQNASPEHKLTLFEAQWNMDDKTYATNPRTLGRALAVRARIRPQLMSDVKNEFLTEVQTEYINMLPTATETELVEYVKGTKDAALNKFPHDKEIHLQIEKIYTREREKLQKSINDQQFHEVNGQLSVLKDTIGSDGLVPNMEVKDSEDMEAYLDKAGEVLLQSWEDLYDTLEVLEPDVQEGVIRGIRLIAHEDAKKKFNEFQAKENNEIREQATFAATNGMFAGTGALIKMRDQPMITEEDWNTVMEGATRGIPHTFVQVYNLDVKDHPATALLQFESTMMGALKNTLVAADNHYSTDMNVLNQFARKLAGSEEYIDALTEVNLLNGMDEPQAEATAKQKMAQWVYGMMNDLEASRMQNEKARSDRTNGHITNSLTGANKRVTGNDNPLVMAVTGNPFMFSDSLETDVHYARTVHQSMIDLAAKGEDMDPEELFKKTGTELYRIVHEPDTITREEREEARLRFLDYAEQGWFNMDGTINHVHMPKQVIRNVYSMLGSLTSQNNLGNPGDLNIPSKMMDRLKTQGTQLIELMDDNADPELVEKNLTALHAYHMHAGGQARVQLKQLFADNPNINKRWRGFLEWSKWMGEDGRIQESWDSEINAARYFMDEANNPLDVEKTIRVLAMMTAEQEEEYFSYTDVRDQKTYLTNIGSEDQDLGDLDRLVSNINRHIGRFTPEQRQAFNREIALGISVMQSESIGTWDNGEKYLGVKTGTDAEDALANMLRSDRILHNPRIASIFTATARELVANDMVWFKGMTPKYLEVLTDELRGPVWMVTNAGFNADSSKQDGDIPYPGTGFMPRVMNEFVERDEDLGRLKVSADGEYRESLPPIPEGNEQFGNDYTSRWWYGVQNATPPPELIQHSFDVFFNTYSSTIPPVKDGKPFVMGELGPAQEEFMGAWNSQPEELKTVSNMIRWKLAFVTAASLQEKFDLLPNNTWRVDIYYDVKGRGPKRFFTIAEFATNLAGLRGGHRVPKTEDGESGKAYSIPSHIQPYLLDDRHKMGDMQRAAEQGRLPVAYKVSTPLTTMGEETPVFNLSNLDPTLLPELFFSDYAIKYGLPKVKAYPYTH